MPHEGALHEISQAIGQLQSKAEDARLDHADAKQERERMARTLRQIEGRLAPLDDLVATAADHGRRIGALEALKNRGLGFLAAVAAGAGGTGALLAKWLAGGGPPPTGH